MATVTVTQALLHFTVTGKPEPGGSKIAGTTKAGHRFVRDDNPAVREWRIRVGDAAGRAMAGRELLRGPLILELEFYLVRPRGHFGTGRNAGLVKPSAPRRPTVRPDTTKLVRAVEDALKGVVWADDAQVVSQEASKWYGEPARVEVWVSELHHPLEDTP